MFTFIIGNVKQFTLNYA